MAASGEFDDRHVSEVRAAWHVHERHRTKRILAVTRRPGANVSTRAMLKVLAEAIAPDVSRERQRALLRFVSDGDLALLELVALNGGEPRSDDERAAVERWTALMDDGANP